MEHLKKNLAYILLAILSLAGAILILIPMLQAPEFIFVGAAQLLGLFLFFLGLAAYFVVKMITPKKMAQACVLLLTGLAVTAFLCIGVGGFNENLGDAEGAMGKSYASFSSEVANIGLGRLAIASEGRLVFNNISEAEAMLGTMKGAAALTDGIDAFLSAGIPPETPVNMLVPTITAVAPPQEQDAINLVAGLAMLGVPDSVDLTTAKIIVTETTSAVIGGIETALSGIAENEESAEVGATALLYIYYSLILAFGVSPIVIGVKKFVCKEDK
jgi:hypothetical protein